MLVSSAAMLSIQGIDLELVERGSGDVLMFLHDEEATRDQAPFVEQLSRNFRVLLPSHPGFGRSPLPDSFDSVDDLAFFYLDVLEQLDLENVLLAGASLGGWVAAEIAVRCCERLRGLILVDPLGIKPGDRETRDIADVFALPFEEVRKRSYYRPPPVPDTAAMTDEELAIIARNREALALYTWEPYANNPKLLQRLHRVKVPSLLVWGASDGIVTPDYGRAYRAAIPGAEFELIGEAGHFPHIEQPQAFVERVLAFEGRIQANAGGAEQHG
jgi:pimeloyl-ACP methyl ester carboxylesterase